MSWWSLSVVQVDVCLEDVLSKNSFCKTNLSVFFTFPALCLVLLQNHFTLSWKRRKNKKTNSIRTEKQSNSCRSLTTTHICLKMTVSHEHLFFIDVSIEKKRFLDCGTKVLDPCCGRSLHTTVCPRGCLWACTSSKNSSCLLLAALWAQLWSRYLRRQRSKGKPDGKMNRGWVDYRDKGNMGCEKHKKKLEFIVLRPERLFTSGKHTVPESRCSNFTPRTNGTLFKESYKNALWAKTTCS